jgi:hypothetical protein
MAVLRVTTCGLRITRFFELGGIDVEIGGGWVVVLGLCAGMVMAGPGQHSVAVTLNYDFSVDNALNQQLLGQQQQMQNSLLPQYQSIANNPGYSAADKAAITGQSQGALASAFDALQQSAQNRVARTGNSAGFSDLTDELARQKGIVSASTAQQNQMNFSNTAYQRQMAALQGLSGLYGVDTNLLGKTLGIPAELLNVRSNASRNNGGFFSSLGSSLGGVAGGIPSLFL